MGGRRAPAGSAVSPVDQALNAWRIHSEINLLLLEKIPAAGLKAVPLESRGRTIAQQIKHMTEVREGLDLLPHDGQAAEAGQAICRSTHPSPIANGSAAIRPCRRRLSSRDPGWRREHAGLRQTAASVDGLPDLPRVPSPGIDRPRAQAERHEASGGSVDSGPLGEVDVGRVGSRPSTSTATSVRNRPPALPTSPARLSISGLRVSRRPCS